MAAGQVHENVFEAGLTRAEMFELLPLLVDGGQQRRNRQMRFAHIEANCTVLMANRLDARQFLPNIEPVAVLTAAGFELDDVMSAETINQIRRR